MGNRHRNSADVGVVAIGRNEGKRLRICLQSASASSKHVVYVDSGSSDDSIEIAKGLGTEIVELDMSVPFTAARARNAGFARLVQLAPEIEYIQFVDGDCEINSNWIETAYYFLQANGEMAVVGGRRRERYPDATVYNLLCDVDWDSPVGEVLFCGGDFMIRRDAFEAVGGFRDDLIAGEEPELCVRLRKAGWKIWRLGAEMTLHDANMTRFSQWWKRDMRCGFTYAQGIHELERECGREFSRAVIWGGLIPVAVVGAGLLWGAMVYLFMLVYPLQVLRMTFKERPLTSRNLINSLFVTIGKFPEMAGVLKYYFNRVFGVTNRLIEYK